MVFFAGRNEVMTQRNKHPTPTHFKHTCQLFRFSRESPSFSRNLPVSRLERQISRELPTVALFSDSLFINFVGKVLLLSLKKVKSQKKGPLINMAPTLNVLWVVPRFLYSGGWQVCFKTVVSCRRSLFCLFIHTAWMCVLSTFT